MQTGIQQLSTSRPRVLGWMRSAAILDGDWGTSIAYVLGISFALAGYASIWHLSLMLGLTTIVALNYITICRLYPNGGGVYSSVYHRSHTLAVVGALLLGADYVITASLSVLDGCHYLGLHHPALWAIGFIALIGGLNWYGPRHSGALAVVISAATLATIIVIIVYSAPAALTAPHIEAPHDGFMKNWHIFVGIILSISGIEAISNMTGLMKDPARNSRRAILAILGKVVFATLFLGLAMHAIPGITGHTEDMVRFIGEHYVGAWFGWIVAFSFGLLLISAGNTALNDLITIQFLMSADGELPAALRRLNRHGVPIVPLLVSTLLPIIVLILVSDVITLSHLYAIGVVGAILINVSSTGTDRTLTIARPVRAGMLASAVVLVFIFGSIAVDKPQASIFASSVLIVGLSARAATKHARRRAAARPAPAVPAGVMVSGPAVATGIPERSFLVAVRGGSDRLLRVALEEARSHNALLYVLHVREISVAALPATMKALQPSDEEMAMLEICASSGVHFRYLSIVSYDVGYTITEQAAMLGVDRVLIGVSRRGALEKALKGSVVTTLTSLLPEEIQLMIFG
jgi:amino acid transporter